MTATRKTTIIDLHHPPKNYPDQVITLLQQGGIIAYPTDTIYGLGCDAYNATAVEQLSALKGRPLGKPLSVLYSDVDRLLADFPHLTAFQNAAVRRLLPGKITLILPAPPSIPLAAALTAGGWLGVRVIALPVINTLLKHYPTPITTTSVNPAGQPPAKSVPEILSYFAGQISLILDYGTLHATLPSTVVRLTATDFRLERPGAVPISQIEEQLAHL